MARRRGLRFDQRAGIVQLPPGFIHHHRYGIRQVHAAALRLHWDADFLLRGQRIEDVGRQSTRFRTEQQVVAGLVADGAVRRRALGGEGKQPLRVFGGEKSGVVGMTVDAGELMVIQPSVRILALLHKVKP